MKKGNILIIDDEEKLRNLFGRIIKAEGFEVFEASDCKTGLKRFGNRLYSKPKRAEFKQFLIIVRRCCYIIEVPEKCQAVQSDRFN